MLLLNVAIPAAPQIYFGYLLEICAFSLLPTDEIFGFVFNLREADPVSINFDEIGYGTAFYVLNVGDLFLAALSFPLRVIHARILLKINPAKYKTKAEKLIDGIYWNDPITLIEEGFLITCVSAFLGIAFYD